MARVPWFAVLHESVAYDPYEVPRLPAAHTIPVASPAGDVPPPFTQAQLDSVGGTLSNPLTADAEVLARGNVLFQRHCMACHGPQGLGNGPVVGEGKFPYAPSVISAQAAGYTDGYLYGIVRVGRGLMPSYGDRMPHLDRWAVVSYLRQLQRQGGEVAPALVQPVEAVPESLTGQPETQVLPSEAADGMQPAGDTTPRQR